MLTASLLGFSPATGSALGFSSFGCDWAVSRCSLRLANQGHDKMSQELKVCVLSLGTKLDVLDARNLSVAAKALAHGLVSEDLFHRRLQTFNLVP